MRGRHKVSVSYLTLILIQKLILALCAAYRNCNIRRIHPFQVSLISHLLSCYLCLFGTIDPFTPKRENIYLRPFVRVFDCEFITKILNRIYPLCHYCYSNLLIDYIGRYINFEYLYKHCKLILPKLLLAIVQIIDEAKETCRI